jgi:hypothetical protein
MRTVSIILHIAGQGNGREGVIFGEISAKLLTAENAEVAENFFVSVLFRSLRHPPYFCLAII